MKFLSIVFSVAFSIVFLISCGSSIESEQNSWESNKKTVEEYSAKYPFLADKIDAQFKEAQALMQNTQSIGDEKERISAMQKANAHATAGAIREIRKIERSIESLTQEIENIKEEFTSEEFSQKTVFLLGEAKESLERVNSLLASATASTADNVLVALGSEYANLDRMERNLDSHYDEVIGKRPKESENQEEQSPVDSVSGQHDHSRDTVKVAANIKCAKCGSMISADALKCKNCGAPVKK